MYNVNGKVATLVQFNRTNDDENIYDDQDTKELDIIVCPYNVDQAVRFGIYTVPEATGYFIIKSKVDVREGDQIIFNNEKYTILKVQDNWIWNKIANISIAVK
jgi:hypothetical protein